MPLIYLSSFQKAQKWEFKNPHNCFSIAVYQPKWVKPYQEASVFNILDANGDWIRPRNFIPEGHDPTQPDNQLLGRYFDALLEHYDRRRPQIEEWLASHTVRRVNLLCWCPYDRAAKRQLKDYGSFVCHSAAVGFYLQEFLGQRVQLDTDRKRMAWPEVSRSS